MEEVIQVCQCGRSSMNKWDKTQYSGEVTLIFTCPRLHAQDNLTASNQVPHYPSSGSTNYFVQAWTVTGIK